MFFSISFFGEILEWEYTDSELTLNYWLASLLNSLAGWPCLYRIHQ